MTNNRGPRQLPWGTPKSIPNQSDNIPSTVTFWEWLDKYEANQSRTFLDTPNSVHRRFRRIWWSTVSKAALRSRRIRSVACCLSMLIKTSFLIFNRAVSVLSLGRYANWSVGKRLFLTRWDWSWSAAAHSTNLETNCRWFIGQKFLKARSDPHFFSMGVTRPSFHTSGKTPDCNDW